TTAHPSSRSLASRSSSSSQVRRSWPNVGSSSTSTRGAVARAVATLSRRCSPPDSVYGVAPARWASRSRDSRSSTVDAVAAALPPRGGGARRGLVGSGGGGDGVRGVREARPAPARPRRGAHFVGGAIGVAGGGAPARRRCDQAAQYQCQRGLAGAVGTAYGE